MWNRYLLDEIEAAKPAINEALVWFLSGAGIALKTSRSLLYIDPYFGGSPSKEWLRMTAIPINPSEVRQATAILSTHEHTDHCHRDTIMPILENTDAVFIGPSSSVRRVRKWAEIRGLNLTGRVIEVSPGDSLSIEDLTIRVFQSRDLYSETPVTYLVETPAGSIFHSGDSSYFPGLKEIGDYYEVNVAFLSLGRNFRGRDDYMTPCDIVRAAIDLKARIIVPIHYDLWKVTREDPQLVKYIAELWHVNIDVRILALGDCLKITGK